MSGDGERAQTGGGEAVGEGLGEGGGPGDEAGGVMAEGHEFADHRAGDKGEGGVGDEQDGVDAGEGSVGVGEVLLEGEIGGVAYTAYQSVGTAGASHVDSKAGVGYDFDVRTVMVSGGYGTLSEIGRPVALFVFIDAYGYHYTVKQP